MDEATLAGERCGYAITDSDGDEQPCDRPATGWRWYQDCGHEDTLDVACDWHANKGGQRIADAEAEVRRLSAAMDAKDELLYDAWCVIANSGVFGNHYGPTDGCREAAIRWRDAYRAALAAAPSGEPDTEEAK